MAVLETSFLIDILRNYPPAVELLDQLEQSEAVLYVTSPTVMELWEGALQSHTSEKEKQRVDELLSTIIALPLDPRSAKQAAEINVFLFKSGQPIEIHDVMISAITQNKGEILVTRDAHYTRIPGLRVLKY